MASDAKVCAMMETLAIVTATYVLDKQRRRARTLAEKSLLLAVAPNTKECWPASVGLKVRVVSEARLGSKVGGIGIR